MNSRERRAQAYRAKCAADNRLGRKIESTLSGCSDRVLKAVSCTEYKMKMRSKKLPEAVTRENPTYRKLNNPLGQITNARQKMRGKSIPLI